MNLNDILSSNSSEIIDLFNTIEKANENITANIEAQKPMLSGEIFLDNNEVCKMLHLSSRTLQDYRDKAFIAFYKIEGKILYKISDVRKMLEQHYYDAWKQKR